MRLTKRITLIILSVLLWSAFIGFGFINGFLLKPITLDNSPQGFIEAAKDKVANEYVGNLAMALIEDGVVVEEYFYDIEGHNIDQNSAFPVASVSKWVTSVGVMKLVENGQIDLDEPIDNYLTRWHLPPGEYDNNKVTVRRLLSHSAGLDDGLGYNGFTKDENMQTLEESLTKAADAGSYAEGKARVGYEPGSQYMYSGAGYALLQLLIEEISKGSFQKFMQEQVFNPLEMTHSSYILSDSTKIGLVPVYRNDGPTRPMNRFTAKAASSLMTSTSDIAKFMIAQLKGNQVLSDSTIKIMTEAESFRHDIGIYGLGPHLYSQDYTDSKIIGHDGSGNDAINSAARIDLLTGDGIIIFETGNYSYASVLADEWMFREAGIADRVVMERNMPFIITLLIIGYLLITMGAIFLIRKKNLL
ncbi:serine hydrolase [Mangrovivirga sp. M17]|uniref:Serine hydrolase n=1 Tax=Mangrovivirga halotolerans TaxID=2993936 RepID=A0ABT3RV78_9BACT|nr:serine hydrolase domain-containing protein [Mangrovivirga halotolerans]MCX2745497.1 serine hydrolase [Mangrovivirga halotolerans]